jgi:hypothetical protein
VFTLPFLEDGCPLLPGYDVMRDPGVVEIEISQPLMCAQMARDVCPFLTGCVSNEPDTVEITALCG